LDVLTESFLAGCIPHLKLDTFSFEFDVANLEVDPLWG